MNAFAISGLSFAIPSIALGIFSLIKGRKKIHLIWGFFSFSVAWWGFGIYKFATATDMTKAIFWLRITEIGVIFIPVLLTHFVMEFLNKYKKWFIFISYIITFIFLFFNIFTNHFINQVHFIFDQFYYPLPTPLYTLFIIIFIAVLIYNILKLWQAYKKSYGIIKSQIRYLLLAFLVGFSGGITSYLLLYGIKVYPAWNATIFISASVVTYAIITNRLFDIRVVLTSLFVGLIAILLLIDALVFTEKLSLQVVITKGGILAAFLFFGYLLIKSVLKEIKLRERIKKAYEVEKRARAEIEKITEAKTQFIMATQHHLRTPLTSMIGYLDLLFGGTYGKVPPKIKLTLQKFQVSTRRLIRVVSALLDISQFQMGKKVVTLQPGIDFESLLKEVTEELQFEVKTRGLYLKYEKTGKIPTIKADPEKLKVALFNIIDNGIKYTRKGGIIVKCQITNSKLQITVKDTGIGIEPSQAKKLFKEAFARGGEAKKVYGFGRGIGLFITGHIIKAHNGKIWAESEGVGKGSTFYIELPIS